VSRQSKRKIGLFLSEEISRRINRKVEKGRILDQVCEKNDETYRQYQDQGHNCEEQGCD